MSITLDQIKVRHDLLKSILDEKQYRMYLASEAISLGWGGVSKVALATGASRNTVSSGLSELAKPRIGKPIERQRQQGGGRKRTTDIDLTLKADLDALIEPFAAGDPCSPLRWTCKSISALTSELISMGHKTSTRMVHELLIEARYRMQSNRKTKESGCHPDRNDQFIYINEKVKSFQEEGYPVIAVGTKKKEIVGEFAYKGCTWRPQGYQVKVTADDFPDLTKGRTAPYCVYDSPDNADYINVGISADTSAFAVESIRRWWLTVGKDYYTNTRKLLITSGCKGSNVFHIKPLEIELQCLADEMDLEISVCHLPPGTSKWNMIENIMFSHISMNWQGESLISIETIIDLVGSTKPKKEMATQTAGDTNRYARDIRISASGTESLLIKRDVFHSEWNYTISPRKIAQTIL